MSDSFSMTKRLAFRNVLLALAFFGPAANAAEIGVAVVFSDGELATIRAYYANSGTRTANSAGMSMGMGGGLSALPPGIAKHYELGKPLPPGIAKQVLPAALRSLLPPAPTGHERIVVAGKILLVAIATQVIVDVISDILLD